MDIDEQIKQTRIEISNLEHKLKQLLIQKDKEQQLNNNQIEFNFEEV